MATINASVSNFFSIADLAAKGIGTGQTISHPTIPTFFSNSVKSTGVNYASTYFNSILGNNTLSNVVSDYDSAKSSFQSEFKQAMGDAKKTGEALKTVDYRNSSETGNAQSNQTSGDKFGTFHMPQNAQKNILGIATTKDTNNLSQKTDKAANEDATDDDTQGIADDEPENDVYSDPLANESRKTPPFQPPEDTAQEITDLIDQYNDAVGYLQSKIGISSQFDYFASSFSNTEDDVMQNMESVGVNMEPTGMLSVDTQTLTKALQEDPGSVEQALGQDGLAGQIDRKTVSSDYQADRVFPRLDEALGRPDDSSKGMYAPNMHIASTMRGNRGNLMDMYY
ncbi:MAG: flagellar filament capping protein FliD [Selenomonadaceae bacterium]|nr:flagellar filament capping protein FliD [Selenomonadaceae bacterium]